MAWRTGRRVQTFTIGAVIAVAVVVGAGLWVGADNGTKQSELGAGLVSTGLFGLLLLMFERVLSEQTREVERKVSLAAAPEPTIDVQAGAGGASGESEEGMSERAEGEVRRRSQFKAEVGGWRRDTGRIDADQLRLVVYRDDDYFQFFTAIVPGIAFRVGLHGRSADGVTLAQFRRAIAELAVTQIRQAIATGLAPRDGQRTTAIELFPDVDEAIRLARHQDDEEPRADEVITVWEQ